MLPYLTKQAQKQMEYLIELTRIASRIKQILTLITTLLLNLAEQKYPKIFFPLTFNLYHPFNLICT